MNDAEGEWTNEPDRKHWVDQATGLDCLIVRNRLGALCGYVGVPEGHPYYGKDYNDDALCGVDVHGGLTYSDHCRGDICHTPEEAANEPVWWLGFDCAHAGDLCPKLTGSAALSALSALGGAYRNMPYVESECRDLAKQLAAVGLPQG